MTMNVNSVTARNIASMTTTTGGKAIPASFTSWESKALQNAVAYAEAVGAHEDAEILRIIIERFAAN